MRTAAILKVFWRGIGAAWRCIERGKREETDEGARGFIGESSAWRWGKGLAARGDQRAGSQAVHAQVSWPELGDDPTGGVHLSVGVGGSDGTLSGFS
jgi:hypothetical protein